MSSQPFFPNMAKLNISFSLSLQHSQFLLSRGIEFNKSLKSIGDKNRVGLEAEGSSWCWGEEMKGQRCLAEQPQRKKLVSEEKTMEFIKTWVSTSWKSYRHRCRQKNCPRTTLLLVDSLFEKNRVLDNKSRHQSSGFFGTTDQRGFSLILKIN